jgi:hypothetical protein
MKVHHRREYAVILGLDTKTRRYRSNPAKPTAASDQRS